MKNDEKMFQNPRKPVLARTKTHYPTRPSHYLKCIQSRVLEIYSYQCSINHLVTENCYFADATN